MLTPPPSTSTYKPVAALPAPSTELLFNQLNLATVSGHGASDHIPAPVSRKYVARMQFAPAPPPIEVVPMWLSAICKDKTDISASGGTPAIKFIVPTRSISICKHSIP